MSKDNYDTWNGCVNFDALVGKRITKITGVEAGSDFVEFHCDDGTTFGMFHDQDCCESVDLHEFDGDPQRTIGLVTAAREETSTDRPALSEWDDSHTWTFYVLETEGGTLHLRWYGTSNGYSAPCSPPLPPQPRRLLRKTQRRNDMKPMLTKAAQHPLYYYRNGMRIEGPHPGLLGNVSGLRGDVSGLRGNVSGLWGNVSGLRGDVSSLWGDVSDLRGNVHPDLRGDVSDLRGNVHPDLRGDVHPDLRGNVSGLRGDVSDLRGDVSGLRGDVSSLRGNVSGLRGDVHPDLRGNVSGLRGNVSGLWGDVTGLRGDLDACEITDAERGHGIDVATLVRSEP